MYRGIILSFFMIFFSFLHCSSGQGIAWSASRSAPSSSGSDSSSSSDSSCGMSYCNRSIASMRLCPNRWLVEAQRPWSEGGHANTLWGRLWVGPGTSPGIQNWSWSKCGVQTTAGDPLFPDASAAGAGGLIVGGFSWKQNHLTKICITMHLFYLLINN